MKTCFKCNRELPLDDFYVHKMMGDGHLGKCKDCTKKDVKERSDRLRKDPEWMESERARGRDKHVRLYRECLKPYAPISGKHGKPWVERYPEKKSAVSMSGKIYAPKGCHKHHWSYRPEHAKDVMFLARLDHYTTHRVIIYDQERMQYRGLDGVLLDTKERHLAYIAGHGVKPCKTAGKN